MVEDEVLLHEAICIPLQDGGYQVVTATSAAEAIAELGADGASYQALLTDINLGRNMLTGWDVARRARELFVALPIIYMTGESGREWAIYGVPNSVLLLKPFAPAQAVTAISQLLNEVATQVTPPAQPG